MPLDLSFKQVCDFIKKDDPALIDAVDKLLGLTLVCSPLLIGPAAATLLPIIAVKNEVVKLGKHVFEAFSKRNDADYIARQQRMEIAYGLICFTAFFEALDRQIPEELRAQIGFLKGEKIFIAKSARGKSPCPPEKSTEDAATLAASSPLAALTTPFPHPTETLEQQVERHAGLWKQMAQGFYEFLQKLAFWDEINEKERAQLWSEVEKVPPLAAVHFDAQYLDLARRYEDFAVWANLQEHKKTKALIGSLSKYVQQHAALVKSGKTAIDIGFGRVHDAVVSIPEILKVSQSSEIAESLKLYYEARIVDPIAEEKYEPGEDKPRLRFPLIRDAFIPQSFRVLRWTPKVRSLEDEATWKDQDRRDDLGAFLLSYLSSPYSTETPMVVLGHPGGGKSLLTTVLSAQLMSKQYTAIRVPLREVDAEAGIVAQIEEGIRSITNISVDSWAKLSGAFKNNPPLVILDGYDELLQASGKVFSTYLKDVQNFQKNEAEQARPVRVIVTSRLTLIDKATIPPGATIVRLLEFNKRQRDRWVSIWNRENVNYFHEANIKEFDLPKEDDDGAAKVLSLAEQPLLLLMLALYDSQDNQLRGSKALDRTILYDSLLRQFVTRERKKDSQFAELSSPEQDKELDTEMQRLGIAALGMYNRRKLHILSNELNDDIKFFNLERAVPAVAGRPLTQADLLLGSFFFVHKSKAQLKAGASERHEETAAFEFLHNTFGEFLTADFILRQAVSEAAALKALMENENLRLQLEQQLGSADGPSRAWFASLIYTPLFTRPVVMEMMREWIGHALKRKQLSKKEFLSHLDTIVLNQIKRLLGKREMPSIIRKETAQEGYRAPFGDHPLLGHIAIYTMNLVLLRIIVGEEPVVLDEGQIGTHEDGARPWDRLTHIWRSWFSLDNLNGVTAVMVAKRKGSQITIRAKEKFKVAESRDRLETCLNVSLSLADNISSGLTGLLLFDPSRDNQLDIEDVAERLTSEKIDVDLQIAMKRLAQIERRVNAKNAQKFFSAFRQTLEIALRGDKSEELELICMGLPRAIRRIKYREPGGKQHARERFETFLEALHPKLLTEVVMRNPGAARDILRAVKEIPNADWRHLFGRGWIEFPMPQSDLMEMMDRDPDVWNSWWQLVRELGGMRDIERYDPRVVHPEVMVRAIDPRRLLKLSESNPEAAVAWLQMAREAVGEDFMRRVGPVFDRAIRSGHFLELAEWNPEAALAWVQLAREVEGEDFLQRLGPEFFERALQAGQLLELAERNPEAALAWIQLAREVVGEAFFRRLGPEFFGTVFHPRYLLELTERNPEAALAWVQLAREIRGELFLRQVGPEFFERAFHPRYLMELAERNPEAALAWVQLAREFGGEDFLRRAGPEFFERLYSPRYFSRLLHRKPVVFGTLLHIVRASEDARTAEAILTWLSSPPDRPRRDISMLNSLPLSAIPDLQWLGDKAAKSKKGELLCDWLREHGLNNK